MSKVIYGYLHEGTLYSPKLNKISSAASEVIVIYAQKNISNHNREIISKAVRRYDVITITDENKLSYAEYLI